DLTTEEPTIDELITNDPIIEEPITISRQFYEVSPILLPSQPQTQIEALNNVRELMSRLMHRVLTNHGLSFINFTIYGYEPDDVVLGEVTSNGEVLQRGVGSYVMENYTVVGFVNKTEYYKTISIELPDIEFILPVGFWKHAGELLEKHLKKNVNIVIYKMRVEFKED
ncbi:unnamed protein product, partial [Cercopithifilaria johnstoni]